MRNCDIKFVNKEITPFGGLSLFFKMLEKCHFEEHVMQSGVPLQGSNRGYKPIQLILGLFAGVWCGASCFGHLDVVRYDAALCDLLGWERGADHRAYQRYLNKFSQAVNQRVFGNLFRWFFSELKFDNYTLDFDSTVMVREGSQEGAAKGYNPKRPGRLSHHPLLAFVSDVRMIANYWLRPGNTSASTNYLSFLEDTLSKLEGKRVGLIRMDSGFFAKEILDYLENKEELDKLAEKVIYTGPIDAYFNYKLGTLEYRSVRFENEILDKPNFQGNAAVNYTDRETPWTRIIEHKWFEFGKDENGNDLPKTVISREYSSEWKLGDEPYYPVNDTKNSTLYEQYKALAEAEDNVIFGGRLGEYKYYDMDKTIEVALTAAKKELS